MRTLILDGSTQKISPTTNDNEFDQPHGDSYITSLNPLRCGCKIAPAALNNNSLNQHDWYQYRSLCIFEITLIVSNTLVLSMTLIVHYGVLPESVDDKQHAHEDLLKSLFSGQGLTDISYLLLVVSVVMR